MAGQKNGEPSWKWRRLLIYIVTAWAFYQIFVLVNAPDTRVNDTIAWGMVLIVLFLVLGYTGLATAQDIAAIWTTRTAKPYSDPPQEPTPAPPLPINQTVVVQPPPQPGSPE